MQLAPRSRLYSGDDQSWLGSRRGTETPQTCTIVTSTLTANTHYPNGYVLSGMPLGKFTSGGNIGKFGLLNTAASDGSQTLWGYLLTAQEVLDPTQNITASLIEYGRIKLYNLPSIYSSLITSGVQSANPRFVYVATA